MNSQPQEVIDMLRGMIASQQDVIKADNEMIEAQDTLINELREERIVSQKLIANLETQIKLLKGE